MSKPITRTYGSASWKSLEDRWIAAKAKMVAAQAELKATEEAMQKEIHRRGDTPEVVDTRIDIDGVKLDVQFRLNAGRVTIDSPRLRAEQPELAEEYSKIGSPFFTFKPTIKIAAAVAEVA